MGRHRKQQYEHLPPNLYQDGGRLRYRRPTDGQLFPMGTDLVAAIQAATELNALYAGKGDLVAAVLGRDTPTLAAYCDTMQGTLQDKLDAGQLADATFTQYKNQLTKIRGAKIGKRQVEDVTVLDCNQFLADFTPRLSQLYRGLLAQMFRHIIAAGYRAPGDNPAEATLPAVYKVQRERLTLEQFNQVYAKAGELRLYHLQHGMDLALRTLQRRTDLVAARFADWQDERLLVVQSKTGQALAISGADVAAVVRSCRDGAVSHHLLHYPRSYLKRLRGKPLSPEVLTKSFSRCRDELKLRADIPTRQRPSFHEIRALGAELYKQAGRPEAEIQALLGHASPDMTRVYLSRHHQEFKEVGAGLVLP